MSNVKRSIAEFGNGEKQGGARFTVEIGAGLSPKGHARTINYTVGGSADLGDGKDFTIDGCTSSPCSLRLPANRHSDWITIYVNDDGIDENNETIVLTLQDGSGYTVNRNRVAADDPRYTHDKTTVTITDDDTRGLDFRRRWAYVGEGGSETYTVRLASQPTAAVTVKIVSNNPDVTVNPTSLTFNPSGGTKLWSRAQTVTVSAAQDDDAVDDEATLTYTTSGGDYGGAGALSIDRPVSVDDDDTAADPVTPRLSRISVTGGSAVTEGAAASFTLNADPAPTARISVNVEVIEPLNQDFVASSQEGVRTVTLNAGATSAAFTVPTVDDSNAEGDGFVQVFVNDGTGYSAGGGDAVTVRDNDHPIPAASFAAGSSSAAESAGTHSVTVNLSQAAPPGGLTLSYGVAGTATAGGGNDFTIQNSGSLIIAAGATTADIPVAINDDSAAENAETVILTLTGGTGYTLGSPRVHTLTITDNDGQATLSLSGPAGADEGDSGTSDRYFTVSLSRAPSRFVSWQLCFGGSATIDTAGGGTIPAGADYQAISGQAPIDLSRRSPVCTNRIFRPSSSSFTNTDLGIRIRGDTESESDETVTVTLRIDDGPADVVLGTSVVTYTIRNDDDTSQPAASFALGSSSAAEDAGTRNVRVDLSPAAPSGGLTLSYSVTGTATVGSDFTIRNSGRLGVAAEATSAVIPVAISDDGTEEGDETVVLTLTGGTGYTLGGTTVHTLTITDNDDPPQRTPGLDISPVLLSSVPEGGTDSYNVLLRTQPTGTVTVTITSDNGDVTVSPASLIFQSSGSRLWSTPQTVTVSAAQDDDTRDDAASLSHTASGGGYDTVAARLIDVTVIDDDTTVPITPTLPSISISGGSAVTEGGNAVFTVKASAAPTAALTVTLNVADAATSDFLAASNEGRQTVTFTAGAGTATFTLPTQDDSLDEPAGLLTVTLAEHEDYDLAAAPGNSASIAVEDNDATSVTLAAPAGNIPEAAGTRELTLTLGRALVDGEVLPVEITFGGTATFGSDYQVSAPDIAPAGVAYSMLDSTPTVTFTGGENASTTASLTLGAVQDSADEGDGESVSISLAALDSASGSGLGGGASGSGSSAFAIEDDDRTAEVNLSAEQVGDEGQVSLSATVTLSVEAAADVSVPVQVTSQANGQTTVLATVDAAVSAGGTTATASIVLPEGSVADGDMVTVALGALPDGFAAGDSASVDLTVDVATLVNLAAEQAGDEGRVSLSATVTLSVAAVSDVTLPVQVTTQGGDGQTTVLATVDAAVSAGGTTATASIVLPEGSVADGDMVTVALGALPDGFAEGDSASVDLTVDVATLVNLAAEQAGDEGRVSLSATVTLSVAAVSDVTLPVQVTTQGGDGQTTVLATVDAAVSAGGTTATASIVLPEGGVADGDMVTVALGALPDGFAAGDNASVDLTVDVATLVNLAAEQAGDEGRVSLSATVTLSVAAVSDVTLPVQVTTQGGDGQTTVLATVDAAVSAGGTTATASIVLPEGGVADGDMVTVALGALPDGFAAGDNASVDLTVDVATLVNLSAEQAGDEGRVSLSATVTLSVAAVSDVTLPVQVTAQGGDGQTTVLATVDAAVSAGGATATASIVLPEDSVADGGMVTVALGALPDGFAAGDNASVDLTVDVATLVNLSAEQAGDEGRVSLSATVALSVAAVSDVTLPVQVTAQGGDGQTTVLATVDAAVSAGGTTATANIVLPEGSVADGGMVTVALGALLGGFAEGDSASVDLAVTLIPVAPMVDYAGRWWDVLDGDQREAALFGSDAAPAEAAVARRMYTQLDGRRRLLVNAVAAELYGAGMFESVGEWWQSLDCRLRLASAGEGDMADSANAYCAHYPGSGQSRILGAGEKAFVDRVGLALLGLADIGLYPPAALAIADASVREGPGAVLEFAVSLSEAAATNVRVDWETADGTALTGADYTRAGGTLQIPPGATSATIRVQVLEDSVDEDNETLTVRLSNAAGARLTDGEALGTIMNLQAPPTAWLGRFGRTVSEQLLEGIGDRVAAKRRLSADGGAQPASLPGGSGGVSFDARIGGHSIDQLVGGGQQGLHGADSQARYLTDGAVGEQQDSRGQGISTSGHNQAAPFGGIAGMAGMGSRAAQPGQRTQDLSYLLQTLLSGSSFDAGGSASARSRWGVWGRGAHTRFEGGDAGMTLDGEVTTGQIGADLAYREWLVGLSLSHSMGDGDYQQFGGAGAIESSLTAVTPYVSYGTQEFSIWAAASRGEGDLTLSPAQGPDVETDIEMDMLALGLRTELLTRPNGFGLAVLSDVMMTETSSMGATEMPGTSADASRIRLALEGSLNRSTAAGGQLSVRLEGGVRQDQGDLDDGVGGELAGSLGWMRGGLTFEIKGRGMVTHESEDFVQTGVSAYLAWDAPSSAATAMPSVSLRQSWGIDPESGLDQLFGMREMGNYGLQHAAQSLDAEFSWGLPVLANRFDSSAYLTHGMRADGQLQAVGWRLRPLAEGPGDLNMVLSATRRESSRLPSEHGVGLQISRRW